MNDIQKNYLVGLVLKKMRTFDQDALQEININNTEFYSNIELFIERCANDLSFTKEMIVFQNDDEELLYHTKELSIEKVGLFSTVKTSDKTFTINQEDMKVLLITIVCYMSEYLSLGSVVKVRQDEKECMVVVEQRMIHPKGKNYYIDYRAIPYPMGIFNEQMYIYFNHDDILEVVHKGYNDLENEGYELALKESLIDNNIFAKNYQINNEE